MDYRLKFWIEENLPKDKEKFSRDAVEILLKLLWKEAKEVERSDRAAQDREDKYGPDL